MPHQIFRRNGFVLLVFILALGALCARANVLVYDSMDSLDPDPVHIAPGEAVFWTDGDGGGPYGIYARNGAWNTETDSAGIRFNQVGTYYYYDDNGNDGSIIVAVNIPPSVTITNPATNAVFSAPASFSFAVSASDTDADGLSDVEFYLGPNLIDDVFGDPFATSVTNLSAGTYTLTAIAYDNGGASATNSITITVGSSTLPPALVATQVGNQLVIAWNTNNATGLSLQSTTNLGPSAFWKAAPMPVPIGGQLVVTNAIVSPRQFYRLSDH